MNEERLNDLERLKAAREKRNEILALQSALDKLSDRFEISDREKEILLGEYIDKLHEKREQLKKLLPMLSFDRIKESGTVDTLISLLETGRAKNIEKAIYIFEAIHKDNNEPAWDLLERLSNKADKKEQSN